MAVPTLKQQRQDDLSLLYDTDLPWVEMVVPPGASAAIPVRIQYPADDTERADIQRDMAWLRVKKADWTPVYQQSIEVAGTAWSVASVTDAGLEWRVKLTKNLRAGFGF